MENIILITMFVELKLERRKNVIEKYTYFQNVIVEKQMNCNL